MTRRSLFALPAASGLLRAQLQPSPAIQWSPIGNTDPIDTPGASAAYTKYGVLAQVYSDLPETNAFLVTLRYRAGGQCFQQETLVRRQRDPIIAVWTLVAFYTGQPVEVIDVNAKELQFNGRENTIRG